MNNPVRKIALLGWAQSRHIQKWAEGLQRRGFKVRVFSPDHHTLEGIDTVTIPGGRFCFIRGVSAFRRELELFQPDLLHVHYAGGFGWLGLRSRFRPLVVSAWGADVIDLPRNPLLRPFIRKVLKSADQVTATSRMLKQACLDLEPGISPEIAVIPFGVEIPEERHEVDSATFRLCFIKKHTRKYGPEILLRAIARLVSEGLQLELVMAGQGELTESLKRLSHELKIADRVSFTGFVSGNEITTILQNSQVMVMPSVMESESFGVAVLEASACGRPVIASRIGGVPEVIDDGVTGILVPPGGVSALAESIKRLYHDRDLRQRMGKAGREFVRANYLWDSSLDKMISVYEKILG